VSTPLGGRARDDRAFGLVVPLYEEEERFPEFGKHLLDYVADLPEGSEIVFVDDGSRDGTASLVEELVAAGLAATEAPWAGFCDLDLSTPLEDFDRVRVAALRAPVLAVGSRDLATSRVVRNEGRVRETLGRTYNRLLQATIAPGIVDTQCGAKAASRRIWNAVLPHCGEEGFAWDAEVIAVATALGIGVQEVPIEWRHDDRSKVHVLRDGASMVWATTRIWRTARRVAAESTAAPRAASSAGPVVAPGAVGPVGDAGRPSTEVFDEANAELLVGADRQHWWFRSKAAFVATALRRAEVGRDASAGWLLDVGAGTGGVTAMLGWRDDRVAVAEGSRTLVSHAHREHGLGAVQALVHRLPVADGSVDVVCLLDVIEHLTDPVAALEEAARALSPGGHVVVNVPAHQWLWSAADESLGHVRRYDRRLLRAQLTAAGLEPVFDTHVFSWLVAPVWPTRRLSRGDGAELGLDRTSLLVDRAAMVLTALERELIGRVRLPLGTSLLCVARRRGSAG
jgi:SAM-dependent methyltransferase